MNRVGIIDRVMNSKPMEKFGRAGDRFVEFCIPLNDTEWAANYILVASLIPLMISGLMPQNPEIVNVARATNMFNLSAAVFGTTLMAKMWNKVK